MLNYTFNPNIQAFEYKKQSIVNFDRSNEGEKMVFKRIDKS